MGRPPRLQFEGALYHIYARGNRRERIAHTDRDYRILERYAIDAALKTGVQLRAWYPMPNHMHIIVETPLGNISKYMQMWLSRYARYYNKTYAKLGHLFQGRFGSRLIEKESYLKELIRYVHLQRLRAKDPKSIDVFCDRYSSHRFYIGETCPPEIAAWIEPMIHLFGEDIDQARKNYASFLSDGIENGNWEDFYKPKDDILGSDDFVTKMEITKNKLEGAIKIPDWRRSQLLVKLMAIAADAFGVTIEDLKSKSQCREITHFRQAICFHGRQNGLDNADLARSLQRSQPAVSAMVRLAEQNAPVEIAKLKMALHLNLGSLTPMTF